MPNVPTHGIPQFSWGTSFSPGQLKGKRRGSSGLRRGKAGTTPSPALLGFGSGWGPGAQVWKRLHILETSRAHNRPEDWWLPASSAAAEPSPKGRQTQPSPAAAHLAHTCRGQEDSGADSPPVPAVLGRGAEQGGQVATSKTRRLSDSSRRPPGPRSASPQPGTAKPTAQVSPAPAWIKGQLLHEAAPDSPNRLRPHLRLPCVLFLRALPCTLPVLHHAAIYHLLRPLHVAAGGCCYFRHIFRQRLKNLDTRIGLSAWHKVGGSKCMTGK